MCQLEKKDGRLTLSFTRPAVGGYLQKNYGTNASIQSTTADIIWAVGDEKEGSCAYHDNKRGNFIIFMLPLFLIIESTDKTIK